MSEKGKIGEWISANLLPLLSFAAMAGMGWSSITALQSRVEDNQRAIVSRLDLITTKLDEREAVATCQQRNIDRLADRAGVELVCEGKGE